MAQRDERGIPQAYQLANNEIASVQEVSKRIFKDVEQSRVLLAKG